MEGATRETFVLALAARTLTQANADRFSFRSTVAFATAAAIPVRASTARSCSTDSRLFRCRSTADWVM